MARRLGAVWALALCFRGAHAQEQQPIGLPGYYSIDDHSKTVMAESAGDIDAKIILYPGSRVYPDDLRDMGTNLPACSDEDETVTIEIPTERCLSGEYYLRDNIKILQSPSCPDGSTPTMVFYQNRHCTGSPRKMTQDPEEMEGRCLWSKDDIPISSYYWSLIYRCHDPNEDGAPELQTAEPPVIHQNVLGGVPGNVRYHHGTMFPCHSDFANGTHTTSLDPGNCHWPLSSWPLQSIEIVSPAVCKNGTRAQVALYEETGNKGLDYMCNNGEMTLEKGIMDVDDWMLNTCIDMSRVALQQGGFGRALGLMFFCDRMHVRGEPKEDDGDAAPEPKGSRATHSECATSAGMYQWDDPVRPPTYMYPNPMACMSLPKAHQVRLPAKATCPDGSPGRLAVWQDAGCPGMPRRIEPINRLACENWNLKSESSYMIWCDGEDRADDQKDLKYSTAIAANDPRAVITSTECPRLNMDPGWVVVGREDGPIIQRLEADVDCAGVNVNDQLKVYGNAKCPSGKDARMAVYGDSRCRGEPDRMLDVRNLMDSCTQVCEKHKYSCRVKFTCGGD